MIEKQQSQSLRISQLQTHKLLKVSSHSQDQWLLSLSVIVSSRLWLWARSLLQSQWFLSLQSLSFFLLFSGWSTEKQLVSVRFTPLEQLKQFRSHCDDEQTITCSDWVYHRNIWIISNDQTHVYSCWEFLNLKDLSSQIMVQHHLIVMFCVFYHKFSGNNRGTVDENEHKGTYETINASIPPAARANVSQLKSLFSSVIYWTL